MKRREFLAAAAAAAAGLPVAASALTTAQPKIPQESESLLQHISSFYISAYDKGVLCIRYGLTLVNELVNAVLQFISTTYRKGEPTYISLNYRFRDRENVYRHMFTASFRGYKAGAENTYLALHNFIDGLGREWYEQPSYARCVIHGTCKITDEPCKLKIVRLISPSNILS